MTGFHDLAATALRRLPPELAHTTTIRALEAGFGPVSDEPDDPILRTELAGLKLSNPLGLAAGFDKDARAPIPMLKAGFGFVEIGTVTPRPQAGNPKPRLFRLMEDRAVINRMGFNNEGMEAAAARLEALGARPGPLGVNLGANKDSEDRIGDYITGLRRFWPLADYFTINISSPNTPGLRKLQDPDALDELFDRLSEVRGQMAGDKASPPLFVKLAPDLDDDAVEPICEAARAGGVDALIISNTTLDRPDTLTSEHKGEAGGLSGAPLFEKSTRLLGRFRAECGPRVQLIGVGGVASGADALAKIKAGASAVQLYSALALHGPSLIARIKTELVTALKAEGVSSVAEAVGTGRR